MEIVHPDHLNTPRLIADEQQRTVWRWDNTDPFGGNPPDENPSGLGVFEFPLRFPGQYADSESGLYYNYFRDYDSGVGRYVQSDPIGIYGGLGTYGYGALNPLTYSDQTGEWVWVVAGAGIGAVVNVAATYAWNAYKGEPTSNEQIVAAAVGGAVTGAYGALGGPLGGTVARWLGSKASGAIGIVGGSLFSAAGGYTGQVAANYIDPCRPADPLNAAIWAGGAGAATSALIPVPGLYTLSQAIYFQPKTFAAINRSPAVLAYGSSSVFGAGAVTGVPISPPLPPNSCGCN